MCHPCPASQPLFVLILFLLCWPRCISPHTKASSIVSLPGNLQGPPLHWKLYKICGSIPQPPALTPPLLQGLCTCSSFCPEPSPTAASFSPICFLRLPAQHSTHGATRIDRTSSSLCSGGRRAEAEACWLGSWRRGARVPPTPGLSASAAACGSGPVAHSLASATAFRGFPL